MTVVYQDPILEQVPASDTTVYTAPSSADFESSHVVFAVCSNESSTDTTLTVNLVQNGDAVDVTNRYFPPKTIFAGRTDPVSSIVGAVLKAGDFISVIGGAANNLNLKLGIKEIYTDV